MLIRLPTKDGAEKLINPDHISTVHSSKVDSNKCHVFIGSSDIWVTVPCSVLDFQQIINGTSKETR